MSKKKNANKDLKQPTHIFSEDLDSSPFFGTDKKGFSDQFEHVYNLVCHQSMPPHKYKLAKLVHHNHDLSKRWYVSFWAWDVSKEAYVRKRLFDPINRKKTIVERLREAQLIIRTVNAQLTSGKVLGKDNLMPSVNNIAKLSLLESIDFVYNEKNLNKNRINYTKSFKSLKFKIEAWLKHECRADFPLKKFTYQDAISFCNYVRANVGSNKTFNNYRNDFAIVINFLMKKDENLFRKNPISSVDTLPTLSKKHAAYSDAQLSEISKACIELGYSYTLLFIRFMYYTLSRPNELSLLQVWHIDLEANKINYPAEISKNRREEYIGISQQFKKIIIDSGILNYPKDYYVFGHDKPSVKAASKMYYWRRLSIVLKHLEYDKLHAKHDLYSFKHSGVIALYKATKDILLVQRQCRHTNISQTNTYLRDLGLMDNFEGLNNYTGAI